MPITLPVEARADERSFKHVGQQAESYFSRAGKEASGSFTKSFGAGAKDARKAADGYAKAMDAVADATGKSTLAEKSRQDALDRSAAAAKKAEAAEDQLKAARKSGDAKAVAAAEVQLTRAREAQTRATTAVVKSAEAAGAAKRRELRAVREATTAYRNLEQAQASKGPGFLSGMTSQSSGIVGQFQMLGGMGGKAFVGGAVAAMAAVGLVEAGKKAATLALEGFKSVMETGIDFSKTVNNFQGVTGASAAESQQMSAAARALGADTTMAGVTASEAAKAMTELAKAGFTVDQAISAARGTMQLATAAQVDAAQAAEIQSNAINAFGMSAQDAGRVADVLANAANASSAGMPDLGLALQQVGGIAHGFGEDIEGTVAALGMLANAGVKGSDAGTLLKTTLQSITKQGEPAQQAMQALGMSLYSQDTGQFVGFREMFRQLDEAKKRMSPEQFQAETNILFGSDAMRSAMLGSVAAFDKMEASIGRVGTAAGMAEAQMQGWPGVVEGIDNSIEALKLSFYDLFDTPGGQGLGQSIVDALGGAVDWVNAHKPELLSFIAQFGTVASAAAEASLLTAQAFIYAMSWQSDALAFTLGTAVEGLAKLGNFAGRILEKLPGQSELGKSLQAVTQGMDDFADKWQGMGANMRKSADTLGSFRSGLADLRVSFGQSMADTIAAEEKNREWARSFDAVKGSLEAIPNSHEMVIKDNSAEVRQKLEGLGFHIQNLPDGRQVIRVDYRDSSGNPVSPQMMSKMMGFDVQSFDSAGDAQRARRGLDYNKPGDVAPTAPTPTSGPGVGGILGPGGVLDGSGSGGGAGGPGIAVPYAAIPELMPGVAMDASLFSQQTAVADARTKVAQKEAELNALRADNNASAADILNAQNELEKARRDQTEAEMRFQEAQLKAGQQTTKQLGQLTSELGDIGASIDQDFGISKGLAGIAENVTKFIANLAAAPLMGQLSAVAKANPTQGGHGLMGMLGAQGVFGSQYQNNQYATSGGGYAPVAGSAGVPMYGLSPSTLKDTGSVPSGPQSRTAAALIERFFGDQLRGPIGGSRDTGTAKNTHDVGLSIDIPIGPDQKELGDQINAFLQSNAEALGLEYSIWRDQGKYPGGGGFVSGGHQDHIDAHFNGAPGTAKPGGAVSGFGAPGSKQAIANTILSQALSRGYSMEEAQAILAYAIGESSLNPGISGGPQGGPGASNEVVGLFQQKPAFASAGGIDPSQRSDPAANTYAYLNQLEKNRHLPIEQALPATSVGGPLASGPGAQPQHWGNLMSQASNYVAGYGGGGGGMGVGPGFAPAPSSMAPTRIGGLAPVGGSGGGGIGIQSGGLVDMAIQAGGMGLDMMAPGAGQAVQMGIKLGSRAIEYAGQAAGIGVQGLMETFLPTGGSELANSNWLTRIAGGLAGAAPALPNMAGKGQGGNLENPNGEQGGQQQGGQNPGLNIEKLEYNNQNATEDRAGKDLTYHLGSMYAAPGM